MLSDYLVPVKKKAIYMMITKDKYELPLAVGDSIMELSRILNVDPSSILRGTRRGKSKYVKVFIDIDDDE